MLHCGEGRGHGPETPSFKRLTWVIQGPDMGNTPKKDKKSFNMGSLSQSGYIHFDE